MTVAALCVALVGDRPAASTGLRCRVTRMAVRIPHYPRRAQITGDYCEPRGHSNGALLLLTAGGGEDANYWRMPGLPQDSLVLAAARHGYASLAIDRIGSGRSTTPSSSAVVTYQAQVSTLHQVVTALRARWRTVVGVGHSLGSGALLGVAAKSPHDFDALVLTGYGPTVSPQTSQLHALYEAPAHQVSGKWARLDDGYLTMKPSKVSLGGSFYVPGASAAELRAASRYQDLRTSTELATRPQGAAAAAQGAAVLGPVLVVDGKEDRHYCLVNSVHQAARVGRQCATQARFHAYERGLLPHADLTTRLVPDTGHALGLHRSAARSNRAVLAWTDHALAGRHRG